MPANGNPAEGNKTLVRRFYRQIDDGNLPRFKGSSQHCFAGPSIGIHRGPLPGSSSGGSCGGGC
jgi:hypothetical protein